MSYYTEFVIECDELTFNRLVEYWKYNDWDDYELKAPEHVWSTAALPRPPGSLGLTNTRYLMYFSINHAPYIGEIDEFLEKTIGVDRTRYTIRAKGECDDRWSEDGCGESSGHWVESEYDENIPETRRKAPEGYQVYEYCYIAVDLSFWHEYQIDYTKEEVSLRPTSRSEELDTLLRIAESLEHIEEMLEEIRSNGEEDD